MQHSLCLHADGNRWHNRCTSRGVHRWKLCALLCCALLVDNVRKKRHVHLPEDGEKTDPQVKKWPVERTNRDGPRERRTAASLRRGPTEDPVFNGILSATTGPRPTLSTPPSSLEVTGSWTDENLTFHFMGCHVHTCNVPLGVISTGCPVLEFSQLSLALTVRVYVTSTDTVKLNCVSLVLNSVF